MKEKIRKIVSSSLHELNESLGKSLDETQFDSLELYGAVGVLDSMALVSLVVLVEEKIQEELHLEIILANEKAMSQKYSPFMNLNKLSEYAYSLALEEMKNAA